MSTPAASFEALPPAGIARRAVDAGAAKAGLAIAPLFMLAVLAGAFIALGAAFSNQALAGDDLPYGAARVLAGVTFSLGLLLVVIAGAELFTGDALMAAAWASRRVATRRLLRTWFVVYFGNMLGAGITAALIYAAGIHQAGDGAVGRQALSTAVAKTDLPFVRALVLGILCNALVCLAVWMAYGARSTVDRAIAVVPPIAAFVALGFEHSVANMYVIPYGLLLRADDGWMATLDPPPDVAGLDAVGYLWGNLVPVTIGNVIGGSLLVALVYWTVYLRQPRLPAAGPSDGRLSFAELSARLHAIGSDLDGRSVPIAPPAPPASGPMPVVTILVHVPDRGCVRAIVPAGDDIDLPSLRAFLRAPGARLATEAEIREHFPAAGPDAMPVVGGRGDVVVDESLLHHDVLVVAPGTADEELFEPGDLVRAARARIANIRRTAALRSQTHPNSSRRLQ